MHKQLSNCLKTFPSFLIFLTATAAATDDEVLDRVGCVGDAAFGFNCTEGVLSVSAATVSPGEAETGVRIADTCPTFSWGAAPGAERYELSVFDASWFDSPDHQEQQQLGQPRYQTMIDAPASSWTPAGDDCLEEGVAYRWFVRPHTAEGAGNWSAGRYFEIDYDSDALTQTVRRELAAQLNRPEVWREVIQAALSNNGRLELTTLASAALMPSAATHTTPRAGGTGRASALEIADISLQATTFPNPLALKINSANGVVFSDPTATGSNPPGTGGIPASGEGTRFMWYPGKAALRAGQVSGTQWDEANVGVYSTAMGSDTTASGENSTAIGWSTTASGHYSTAMGYMTAAIDMISTAMGNATLASGFGSTAMGVHTTASGLSSTALGHFTTASGLSSTALGNFTTAESGYETTIGTFNTDYTPSSTSGWESNDRLFVIGNGTSDTARSDALVILKNGNLTIAGQASKPGGGSWANSSDLRLKDILGEYSGGLDEIAALQPVRYRYSLNNARGHDPEPEYVGFIAQQAQEVFPEAVSEGADGYLDFNMHAVNVAMVNAVQTLRDQNQALQEEIAALRAENAALEKRVLAQESLATRLAFERSEEMVILRAELQLIREQISTRPSVQRTAALP